MSLVEKKSLLDRNVKGNEGNPVGQNPPSEGSFFTDQGNSRSPFKSRGDEKDHLVALLKDQVVASGDRDWETNFLHLVGFDLQGFLHFP